MSLAYKSVALPQAKNATHSVAEGPPPLPHETPWLVRRVDTHILVNPQSSSTSLLSTRPMHNDIRGKIEAVFREVFDDESLQLSDSLSTETLPAWDSLGHIRLVSALEDDMALSFTLEEIEAMTSVAKIVAVVASKT